MVIAHGGPHSIRRNGQQSRYPGEEDGGIRMRNGIVDVQNGTVDGDDAIQSRAVRGIDDAEWQYVQVLDVRGAAGGLSDGEGLARHGDNSGAWSGTAVALDRKRHGSRPTRDHTWRNVDPI